MPQTDVESPFIASRPALVARSRSLSDVADLPAPPPAYPPLVGREDAYIRRTVNVIEPTLGYSRALNSLQLWIVLPTHGAHRGELAG